MKTLPLLLGATALASVVASQTNAATVNVTGELLDPAHGFITYTAGNPTFSGTFDDVTGAFNFVWDATWVQIVSVGYGFFTGEVTYSNDGSISSGFIGDTVADTNTKTCVGDFFICDTWIEALIAEFSQAKMYRYE